MTPCGVLEGALRQQRGRLGKNKAQRVKNLHAMQETIECNMVYIYTAVVPVKCIEFYGRVWAREGILTCEGDLNHCSEGPRKSFHKRGAPT